MSDDRLKVTDTLPSYRALARAATILGLPLVPTVISMAACLMLTMISLSFIGNKALFIPLILIPILAFVRTMTLNDDQALRILGLQLMWVARRKNYRAFGQTNTIIATRYGRQKDDYTRFFEENNQYTARD